MSLILRRGLGRAAGAWPALFALLVLALLAAQALGAGSLLLSGLLICALLLLPGLALQSVLAPAWDGGIVETLALAAGASLAAYPLLLAWLTWLGGHWSPPLAGGLLAASALLIYARQRFLPKLPANSPAFDAPTAGLLALVLILALALRFDHLRGILFPGWSDSYQHVTVTKLIIDGGRVPSDYGPLIEIGSFRYHFGFHAVAAFLAWLVRLPAHQAVLVTGQILNALSCVTAYFFVAYGLRNRCAGVVAALTVGLLTIAPASFVNYGRYPQLAGQVLLPVPMALTLRSLWREAGEKAPWGLAAVTTAGLCLMHYRVMAFYACFVIALLLVLAWQQRRDRRGLWRLLIETGRLALLAIALVSPWLIHLAMTLGDRVERSSAIGANDQLNDLSWQFIVSMGAAAPLVIGAALGAVWGLLRRSGRVVVLAVWIALLFLIANPRLLGVPTTFITNGSVVLALYLPVSILGGYLLGDLLHLVELRWGKRLATLALVGLVLAGSLAGLRTLNRRILEPWRFFVTADDLQAAAWIRENVPGDAVFAVQEAHEQGPLTVHGIDAGFWLPYLTGRRTTLPPMPYNGELTPAAADAINRRAFDTGKLPGDHEALARLRAQGVTHAYVVDPRIGFWPDLWQPAAFAADPAYRLLYHEGSVWVFALDGAS